MFFLGITIGEQMFLWKCMEVITEKHLQEALAKR